MTILNISHRREGFKGQRHLVLPPDVVRAGLSDSLIQALMPTAIGMFPKAEGHLVERKCPLAENILIVCLRGKGWFESSGVTRAVAQGDAFVIPAGTAHRYGTDNDNPWSISWVHFRGKDGNAFLKRLEGPLITLGDVVPFHQPLEEIWHVLDAAAAPASLLHAAALLRLLLSRLLFQGKSLDRHSQSAEAKVRETTQWMRDHLNGPTTLNELAALAYLSVPHYCHVFREHFHCSPMEYFARLRMQRAAELLLTTSATAQQVAFALGFSDACYFSRLFRKTMGTAPCAYRRNHRT